MVLGIRARLREQAATQIVRAGISDEFIAINGDWANLDYDPWTVEDAIFVVEGDLLDNANWTPRGMSNRPIFDDEANWHLDA